MGRGIELPTGAPMGGALAIAQPINDVQLVALVASQQTACDPREAVAWAKELVLEAIVQAGGDKLARAIQARQAADAE